MANEFVAKNGLISQNNSTVSGSLTVTQGITGSLLGTSSYATTASYTFQVVSSSFASTASYVLNAQTASFIATASWATNALTSSYPISVAGSTLYSTSPATSNFSANNSIFLGSSAGSSSTSGDNSNFLGQNAGSLTTGSSNSNFLGESAGYNTTNAFASNFIGQQAGYGATNAYYSNFLGYLAGFQATGSGYSNFIGYYAGYNQTSSLYSTLIGYNAGANTNALLNIGTNNIIIGTNITLPNGTQDSINLGGIIFATGSYATTIGNPTSNPQYNIGRVGINKVSPSYTLDVSGSGNFSNALTVTGSTLITGSGTLLQVGSNILFVSSSGNVGIGTTTPPASILLDVAGAIRSLTQLSSATARINYIAGNTQNLQFSSGSAANQTTTVAATMFTGSGNWVYQAAQGATDLGYKIAINSPGVSGSLYVSGSSTFTGNITAPNIPTTGKIVAIVSGYSNLF
jgi:hypothetical protein